MNNWNQLVYALPMLAVTALSASFLVAAARRRGANARPGELQLLAIATFWAFCASMECLSVRLEWARFWCQLQLIAICPFPYAVQRYAHEYSGAKQPWGLRHQVAVSVLPNILFILILTNRWTGFVISDREMIQTAQYVYLHKTYGPGFFVLMAYEAGAAFASAGIILVRMLRNKAQLYFRQAVLVALCLLLMVAGGLVQMTLMNSYNVAGIGFVLNTVAIYVFILPMKRRDVRPAVWTLVINNMRDAVVVLDADRRILDLNPAATMIFGLPKEQLLGRSVADVCPRKEGPIKDHLADGSVYREVTLTRDGTDRVYEVNLSPIHDVRGDVVNRVVVFHDVTARRQSEDSLRQYQSHLEEMVVERTADLAQANAELEQQMATNIVVHEQLKSSEERFSTMFKHAPEPYYLHDLNGTILDGNQAMSALTGHERDTIVGQTLAEAGLMPEGRMRGILPRLAALPPGRVVGPREATIQHINGTSIPVEVRSCLIHVDGQSVILGTMYDLTIRKRNEHALQQAHDLLEQRVAERTQELDWTNQALYKENAERMHVEEQLRHSLAEKEVLLKEIHHRVKNNLQIISSLLSLQASGVENPEVRPLFADSEYRVRSMALIHEKLYRSEDLARIDFHDYAADLANYLYRAHSDIMGRVDLQVNAENVMLAVDTAVPCGLILNELMINAFKHAFPEGRTGTLTVNVHKNGDGYVHMSVADDGVGLPEGFRMEDSPSLGMQLFSSLAEQLGGEAQLISDNGTKATWSFEV